MGEANRMSVTVRRMRAEEYDFLRENDAHADVYEFTDEGVSLHGYVAIHRRRGRLSTGGTRFRAYESDLDGLRDALRLSSAMTSKCVVAGLPYGGGKSVIIGDPAKSKSEDLLRSYAEAITTLQGEFFTGEDVGITEADVQFLMEHSPFFNGKTGFAGDPSPFAAKSVLVTMKKAAELALGIDTLQDRTVGVKGLGKVGGALAKMLSLEGARVTGADIDVAAIENARVAIPDLEIATAEEVPFADSLIYAPCAFGREFRLDNFDRVKARIVCGGANNQLETPSIAKQLMHRGVLYVPDYLANAGGLINVSEELEGDGYHPERVERRISALADLLETSFVNAVTVGESLAESVDAYVTDQLNS